MTVRPKLSGPEGCLFLLFCISGQQIDGSMTQVLAGRDSRPAKNSRMKMPTDTVYGPFREVSPLFESGVRMGFGQDRGALG